MITKKIGIIGCGNMGGAILYGALESGVLNKENVYVYDINPAMMEKAKGWGVNLAENDEDVCAKSEIILLAVKPQNAAEALAQCQKALDGKALMSIVAGVTVERLQNMIDGTSYQKKWTDIFLEEGVDIVIGTHPHVLEPVEQFTREDGHTMVVYYSLGNFVDSQDVLHPLFVFALDE